MIDTFEKLSAFIERVQKYNWVAVDTEFVWERTYYPFLGVIQLACDHESCLVDTVKIKDLSPIGELIANPNIIKILHDAHQDLAIISKHTHRTPKNIFDTKCASGFAGFGFDISLQNLLQRAIGVSIPKTETRTNWLRRPLTEKQIEYALQDVIYLDPLRRKLLQTIQGKKQHEWLMEELTLYDDPSKYTEKDPQIQYRKIKKNGKMSPLETLTLQKLAAWRETEAMARNRPRGHIVRDTILVFIAKHRPTEIKDMQEIKGISARSLKRYGNKIIEAVLDAKSEFAKNENNDVLVKIPDKAIVRSVTELIHMKCKDERIEPTIISNHHEIFHFVSDKNRLNSKHRLSKGWRRSLIGYTLDNMLKKNYKL